MSGSRHARHGARRSGRGSRGAVVGAAVGGVVLLGGLFAAGLTVGRSTVPTGPVAVSGGPPTVSTASSAALPSRPTMLAQITRVVTGDEVVARVGTSDTTVRVLGLDTPDPASIGDTETECGSREALEYADRMLSGQMVTLVPDPTLPEFDDQDRRLSYVVLRTQLSYTDAALMDGIGRADTSRPLWYADVFAREQEGAVDGRVGIWGAPCEARP